MDWKKKLYHILSVPPLVEEPMSKHTSLRIGGPAEFLVSPQSAAELQNLIEMAFQYAVPLFVLGQGTNLLVSDRGLRGIVVSLSGFCSTYEFLEGGLLKAGAAVSLFKLCQAAAGKGLGGLEFATGIPGSMGGALYMNAGAYGSSISNLIREVTTIDLRGKRCVRPVEELKFDYRWSSFQDEEVIILEGLLALTPGDREKILARTAEVLNDRQAKHPHLPNAGSVFRNPPGRPAGKLIEQAGAKGLAVGDAQVSLQHGNFIVNKGRATASDVLKLIAMVKEKVKEKFDLDLALEIKVIGENGSKQGRR